jgi:hypothetical protein
VNTLTGGAQRYPFCRRRSRPALGCAAYWGTGAKIRSPKRISPEIGVHARERPCFSTTPYREPQAGGLSMRRRLRAEWNRGGGDRCLGVCAQWRSAPHREATRLCHDARLWSRSGIQELWWRWAPADANTRYTSHCWACSSVGRAAAYEAEGRGFESPQVLRGG